MEHSRENVTCFYKCFMPDLHAQTINIYVNDSKFERNARLCICASRSQIYRSVDVFFLRFSASLDALSRLIPGEHTTAMLSKPPLHTLRQRNGFEFDWKNKRDGSCTLATSFSNSLDFQPTITCWKMWMFLTSFALSFFLHYVVLNCCTGQQ